MSGAAWDALKRRILLRDEYVCYIDGLPGADTVDHIIPVAEGGAKADPANLAAIHQEPCHRLKTEAEAKRASSRARARRAARSAPR